MGGLNPVNSQPLGEVVHPCRGAAVPWNGHPRGEECGTTGGSLEADGRNPDFDGDTSHITPYHPMIYVCTGFQSHLCLLLVQDFATIHSMETWISTYIDR